MNSKNLYDIMNSKRTYRDFSNEAVDFELIKTAIKIASLAPNGANKQPWTFCVVKDQKIKSEIRKESEKVEKIFYDEKISKEMHKDLSKLNVNYSKPFLEEAPYLICIFKHIYQFDESGVKTKVYYPDISIGIATGFLISALHQLKLETLTYTPQPMTFLKSVLKRPQNEVPYMILVVGKKKVNAVLPGIKKKDISEILKIY